MKKILSLTLLSLALSSCAALTRYKCNREYAVKKGMEDANAGLISMPSRQDGGSCEGDYSSATFSKDYAYGFQQKKQEVCQVTTASAAGRADGEAGQSAKPQKARFNLCGEPREMKKLDAAYEKEFRRAYCAPARASRAGAERAQTWAEADFETAFGDCGNALKVSYMSAYRSGMAANCTAGEAEKFALAEASARRPIHEGAARFDRCPAGKNNLKEIFEGTYLANKDRLDREEAQRVAAEQERVRQQRAAEFQANTATATFIYLNRSYTSRCLVSGDRSFVQVEVENPYLDQVLVRGNWRVMYYNNDFAKITEDSTAEAILITPQNRKTFQKMTLPRDAAYCRAEYTGV